MVDDAERECNHESEMKLQKQRQREREDDERWRKWYDDSFVASSYLLNSLPETERWIKCKSQRHVILLYFVLLSLLSVSTLSFTSSVFRVCLSIVCNRNVLATYHTTTSSYAIFSQEPIKWRSKRKKIERITKHFAFINLQENINGLTHFFLRFFTNLLGTKWNFQREKHPYIMQITEKWIKIEEEREWFRMFNAKVSHCFQIMISVQHWCYIDGFSLFNCKKDSFSKNAMNLAINI